MIDFMNITKRTTLASIQLPGLFSLVLLISGCGDSTTLQTESVSGSATSSVASLRTTVPAQTELDAQADEQWGVLNEYCMDCHNLEDYSGGLALDLMDHESIRADAEVWEKVVRKLRGRMMPPPGQEKPENQKVDEFVAWLEGNLDQPKDFEDPGEKLLHRLNRTE